jgi:hypothetical protein
MIAGASKARLANIRLRKDSRFHESRHCLIRGLEGATNQGGCAVDGQDRCSGQSTDQQVDSRSRSNAAKLLAPHILHQRHLFFELGRILD